jgi:hypothetical protein
MGLGFFHHILGYAQKELAQMRFYTRSGCVGEKLVFGSIGY